MALAYRRSGHELKPVLRMILTSRQFFANLEEPDLVKPPVVYAAGMLRGDPSARRQRRLGVAAVEHGAAAVLPAERGRLADRTRSG